MHETLQPQQRQRQLLSPQSASKQERSLADILKWNKCARPFASLVCNNYIRNYYNHIAQTLAATPAKLEPNVSRHAAEREISLVNSIRVCLTVVLGIASLWVYGATHTVHSHIIAIAISCLYATEMAALFWIRRRHYEDSAAIGLFSLAAKLGSLPDKHHTELLPDSRFRNQVARRLERIARAIERIPLAMGSVSPGVRDDMFRISSDKAQLVRQLESEALLPEDRSYENISKQITVFLTFISKQHWYKMPEPTVAGVGKKGEGCQSDRRPHRPATWIRMVEMAAVILIIAGLVTFAAVLGSKVSAVYPILGTIAVPIIFALLNNAGILLAPAPQRRETNGEDTLPK